jgi:hypothetical protein
MVCVCVEGIVCCGCCYRPEALETAVIYNGLFNVAASKNKSIKMGTTLVYNCLCVVVSILIPLRWPEPLEMNNCVLRLLLIGIEGIVLVVLAGLKPWK